MSDNQLHSLPAWITERSSHPLKDRWISVRADVCRTQEGAVLDPFYVLEFPDWVQIVALDADDRLVLIEQYRHGLGIFSLELPTGGIEPQDANPIAAGRRELEEETGLQADDWHHVATLAANPANQNNRCHIVMARNVVATGVADENPTERLRILRLPVAEAAQLARTGAIAQSMHVAAIALALTNIGKWIPEAE